jgi:hypothetical protein
MIITSETIVVEPRSDKSVTVVVDRPHVRLSNLAISHEIADHFLITGINFGRQNQLLGPGAIPAALFSTKAAPEDYDFDALDDDDNKVVTISATNISTRPRPFAVSLVTSPLREQPRASLRRVLGFGSTPIPPGTSAKISVQPGHDFVADRLVVPSTIADHFSVTSIECVTLEQLATSPIPATTFSEKCARVTRRGLALELVPSSCFLTITVENTSRKFCDFTCAFVGIF